VENKQRLDLRQPANGVLNVLSPSIGPKTEVRILQGSGKAVTLSIAERLIPGTPVSMEVEGGLVLAEVAACRLVSSGAYEAQLVVDQVIPSLHELGCLVEAVMNAGGARRERQSPQTMPR
jgi:hypothetical protein